MFFYEGYTCPVCGEKFKESDDIVACPECGAPHHRDCWKKEGHCHFVADHGTDRQWVRPQAGDSANSAESAVEGKVCPHCGEKNPEFAEFCSRCGKGLEQRTSPAAPGTAAGQLYASSLSRRRLRGVHTFSDADYRSLRRRS